MLEITYQKAKAAALSLRDEAEAVLDLFESYERVPWATLGVLLSEVYHHHRTLQQYGIQLIEQDKGSE